MILDPVFLIKQANSKFLYENAGASFIDNHPAHNAIDAQIHSCGAKDSFV